MAPAAAEVPRGPQGKVPGGSGGGACHINNGNFNISQCGHAGRFTGNRYLIPLIGGSGGEGASNNDGTCRGGGAGGGAITLAKPHVHHGDGQHYGKRRKRHFPWKQRRWQRRCDTTGGTEHCWCGFAVGTWWWSRTGPSGARVHPLRGILNINGTWIFAGQLGGYKRNTSRFNFLRPSSTIRVMAIDGVPVSVNPSGSFALPDVTISKNSSVNIDIQATGIPPGTVVTLQVYSETPAENLIVNETAQATLSGTLQSSTATATFTFPYGFSRGFVRATWTQ